MTKLTFTEEDISPAKAKRYLGMSPGNRRISQSHVAMLAREMAAGFFPSNGDTIRFNAKSELVDGHHRLHAIVLANITMRMTVCRGLSPEARWTIDKPRIRTVADELAMKGIPQAPSMAALGRAIALFEAGFFAESNGGLKPSPREIESAVIRHHRLGDSMRAAASLARETRCRSRAVLGAMHYVLTLVSADRAEGWFGILASGLPVNGETGVIRLRDQILKASSSMRSQLAEVLLRALIVKAWNYDLRGERVTYLRYRSEDDFPLPLGEDRRPVDVAAMLRSVGGGK